MANGKDTVCVFIDGSNLYFTSQKLGFNMDYEKLKGYYRRRHKVLRLYYYTAVYAKTEGYHDRLRPVIDYLAYNGFTVVTKLTKEFTDPESGRSKTKGNMDMELAVDAMFMAANGHMDHMVLLSGDGDFTYLVNKIKMQGVRVTVVSTIMTRPAMIADELRREADDFVDLHSMMEDVMKEPSSEPRED